MERMGAEDKRFPENGRIYEKRILLVDDNEKLCQMVTGFLQKEGFRNLRTVGPGRGCRQAAGPGAGRGRLYHEAFSPAGAGAAADGGPEADLSGAEPIGAAGKDAALREPDRGSRGGVRAGVGAAGAGRKGNGRCAAGADRRHIHGLYRHQRPAPPGGAPCGRVSSLPLWGNGPDAGAGEGCGKAV